MIHVGVIVAVLGVYLREVIGAPPLAERLGDLGVLAWTTLPLIGAAMAYWGLVWRCSRRIDRAGDHRAVILAERATLAFTFFAIGLHVVSVLVFGWLDLVRPWIGDLVLIDELVVLLVPVSALAFRYLVMHPIDRRLREAALISRLERGVPIHPFPSRARFVMLATRQHVLFMLVPLCAIMAWGEAIDRLLSALALPPDGAVATAAQMLGAIALLAMMPPVLCRLWDTVRFSAGPIRSAVQDICEAHRVRVRELLLWRTGGSVINAAVIGMLPRLRYVVITDALIESLEPEQVLAVAAHEVGHVRLRHMPWLAVCVLGCVTLLGSGLGWLANQIPPSTLDALPMGEDGVVAALLGLTLLGVLLALGYMSRRFEWQADAFAARHLSGMRPDNPAAPITEDAARAMSSALGRVARLNGIDPRRFTWRHGSIRTRQARLRALVGRPSDQAPIDRAVRRLKLGALAVLLAGLLLTALDFATISVPLQPGGFPM